MTTAEFEIITLCDYSVTVLPHIRDAVLDQICSLQ